jgi:hypothetical protein
MSARMIRAMCAVALTVAGLGVGALFGSSSAQTSTDVATVTSVPAAQTALADPTVVPPPPGVPDPGATDQAQNPPTTTTETGTTSNGMPTTTVVPVPHPPAPVSGAAVGNAAVQPVESKRAEAKASCAAAPPPTSGLLAVGSAVPGRGHRSLVWLIVVVTVAAAAVAAAAYIRRRRLSAPGATSRTTTLEVVASLVAITGTLAGIAATYVRGAGVKDHPPPTATLVVRDVQARVTHGAYHDAINHSNAGESPSRATLGRASDSALDRLEIGNVAWLQLDVTGYRGTTMVLRWGLFHAGAGAALIPHTTQEVPVPIDDRADVHSQFVPVWLGTPRLARFRAEFWLLHHGQVRQMASTGPMRGITYRYAC